MHISVVKKGILTATGSDIVALYFVRKSQGGILSVHRILEMDDQDSPLAVKQIATRATEDAGDKYMG